MKPLAALTEADVKPLRGVVFDLDGTVLTDGALRLKAYLALHRLADAGLRMVVCTGRPAAWAEAIQRQWPVAMSVAENGAVAYLKDGAAVSRLDRMTAGDRGRRRARLMTVLEQLRARFRDVELADDNLGRLSDITFDIGERKKVPQKRVAELREAAAELGARTFESSIHLHVTLDTDDKASGTVWALARAFEDDASETLSKYAFVGDSMNDEACFSAFRLTFGVHNIQPHARRLSVVPRFVSDASSGEGFAEIATRLLALRGAAMPESRGHGPASHA